MPRMIKHLMISLFIMLPLAIAGCGGGGSDSPTAMFDAARDAAVKNDPVLIWNTLPSKWQADADGLVHEIGKKVPAQLYDKVMATAGMAFNIMKTKEEFVWNTPMVKMQMSQMTPQELSNAKAAYDAIVTLGEALTQSDLSTAAGLDRFAFKSFLTKYGSEIYVALITAIRAASAEEPGAQQALLLSESVKNLMATVVSTSGDSAVVSVTIPGLPDGALPSSMNMQKVEGKWVPAEMAMMFPTMMSAAHAEISNMDFSASSAEVMQVTMLLTMVDAVIGPLEKATTQAEFDQALAGIAAMMGGGR